MDGHFIHTFEGQLPTTLFEQERDEYKGMQLLGSVVEEAHGVIGTIEAFQALPERNQQLVLEMARFAIHKANLIGGIWSDNGWLENFWGLYIVGSRSRVEARPNSDLDLLSVGTFYRNQGFSDWDEPSLFAGFRLETPSELPSEYNIGDVDRKYLIRATPTSEGVLPVDLNVVDLTFWRATLDSFKETMDVAEDGSQLPRIPIFELSVSQDPYEING